MSFQLKSLSVFFLLLLCFFLMLQQYDDPSLKQINNRKLLVMINGLESKEAVFKIGGKNGKEEEEGWELRTAPLGPDPLHHHGADPQKPRTP